MAHKQILFHSAAREKILRGATLLADAVRVTLGPKSKSVLIKKSWGAPIVCNGGVTIAKEFDLKDPEEKSWSPGPSPGRRENRRRRRRWHQYLN
jgi:chaperonin GroEL